MDPNCRPDALYNRNSSGTNDMSSDDLTMISEISLSHSSNTPLGCHPQSEQSVHDRLYDMALKYEIRTQLTKRLHILENFKIVIVCDDSGSMRTTVDGTNRTRWDELCYIVKIVLDIGTIFDPHGVDVFFLNRAPCLSVTSSREIDRVFSVPPRGYTPLVPTLRHVFQSSAIRSGSEKKLLVFVATDGAPTDDQGEVDVASLEQLMEKERRVETSHVMFLLCTDDPACVNYLRAWDEKMANVDVTDDYTTERNRIRLRFGEDHPFSIGDYIVKALIGAIDGEVDNWNDLY